MQLGTFGAILNYAIEIEGSSAFFYDELAKKAPDTAKAAIAELASASRKNKQTLEKTRRMEMQEMILEAITGIDTSNYEANRNAPVDFNAGVSSAIEIEKKSSAFYSDSSSKLGFLPNVSRTLTKIGKDREDRIGKLKACL